MSKVSRKGAGDWKRTCLNAAIVIALVVELFFQVIGLIGINLHSINNVPKEIQEATWLVPTWIATVILVYAAVVLCKVWRQYEKRSLITAALSTIGIVTALIIALTIRAAYDKVVGPDGNISLTEWEWFWQHCSLIAIPLCTAVVSGIHYKNARDERIRKENEGYTEEFNFDADNPLLGDGEDQKSKKLSKKQRKALQEQNGN